MVNSGSFDSDGQGDRNAKVGFTQPHNASDSTQSSSPVTASVAAPCKTDFSQTADSDLPSVAHAIEPTPTKTEFNSDMPVENFTSLSSVDGVLEESEKPPVSEEKTSLCCSLPLDKVQGVLPPYHPPATKTDDEGTKVKQPTRKLLCLYCDRSFVSSNLRQKHVERIHSVKQNRRVSSRRQNQLTVTPCVHCDRLNGTENTLKDLFQHLINEHSSKYFGCLPCEDRFLTSSLLADHNATNHQATVLQPTQNEDVVPPPGAYKTALIPPEVDDPQGEDIPVKITRSRMKPKPEEEPDKGKRPNIGNKKKSAKLKEFRSKKLSVKSSRIALKRRESKRLQALAKLAESQKKKRPRPTEKKQSLNKPEQINSTKSTERIKTNSTCINPYPEFDHFYRVKKITDHSIDNLKISSLTFDDVFDKAFFNRIKCNIEENLLHHIDGKLFKNEESENRISNFEKVSTGPQEIHNSNSENYGCELSLNAVTPVASLSLNSQFGEDFESQIEYGSKPSKKKPQPRKDEIHYKYFTRRKYQASILEHKENRDLSKLDMWTQLVIKKRQQKMLDDKKSAKEILEYTTCDEYKNKLRREELNRILDRRGPFEDLKEEASKKAALDKLNSVSEGSISEESFTEVREVLNEILNRVFAVTEDVSIAVEVAETKASTSSARKPDQREIPAYLNLRRSSSLPSDGEIDKSDKITLICSSQETENFELPTNQVRGKNELIELTGEWARCRMYICAACGAKLPNMKYLLEHKSLYHQNVWVQHYEFVGNQSELYRHLSIPALGKVGAVEDSVQCKLWKRSEARVCTKCGKQCNSLGELHRHILECGGDWTWMLARKKCKYRPFGAKSRRKRRGLIHRIHLKRKTEPTEKRTYKKAFDGPRPKPSDADTIQRMLANLPAKRSTRKLISLQDGIYRSRKKTQINSINQKKVKCGKVIYKSSSRKETTEKTVNSVSHLNGKSQNSSVNRRSLRSLNKVLASRILDTNTKLSVKRKIKALNERRRTRQSQIDQEDVKETVIEEIVEETSSGRVKSKTTKKDDADEEEPEPTPKRCSPRSISRSVKKKMSMKNLLTGKISIKSFFPVKKKKTRKPLRENQNPQDEKLDVEVTDLKTRSKRKSKEVVEVEVEKKEIMVEKVEPKKTKNETFSSLVRSFSIHKKKTSKSMAQEAEDAKKQATNTKDTPKNVVAENKNSEADKSSKKRKLKRSFRNVINRVKKLKIENTPEVQELETKSNHKGVAFLEERGSTPVQAEKIVIPSISEANENTADISTPAPIVMNFQGPNENPPIPETIFKLESNNEKSLQAKGELDFDTLPVKTTTAEDGFIKDSNTVTSIENDTAIEINPKTQPISIETSIKPKIVPLISPNMKGKIRKPTRGLNDCIAMLTSKLQQKTVEEQSTKVIEEKLLITNSWCKLLSPSGIPEAHKEVPHPKPECILRIPTFRSQNVYPQVEETALDLSTKSVSTPDLSASSETGTLFKENQEEAQRFLTTTSMEMLNTEKQYAQVFNSVDRVIEDVVGDKIKTAFLATKYTWNSVDATIQWVIDDKHPTNAELPRRNTIDDIIDFVVDCGKINESKTVTEEKLAARKIGSIRTTKKQKSLPSKDENSCPQAAAVDLKEPSEEKVSNSELIVGIYSDTVLKRTGSLKKRKGSKKSANESIVKPKETDEQVLGGSETIKTNRDIEETGFESANGDLNEAFIDRTDSIIGKIPVKTKKGCRKVGQIRSKSKTKKVTQLEDKTSGRLLLETNLDNLLDINEISSQPDMSTSAVLQATIYDDEDSKMTKDKEMKQLRNEDEPHLLENKVMTTKSCILPSDSEDDIPLAAFLTPEELKADKNQLDDVSDEEIPLIEIIKTKMANSGETGPKTETNREQGEKIENNKAAAKKTTKRSKSPKKKVEEDVGDAYQMLETAKGIVETGIILNDIEDFSTKKIEEKPLAVVQTLDVEVPESTNESNQILDSEKTASNPEDIGTVHSTSVFVKPIAAIKPVKRRSKSLKTEDNIRQSLLVDTDNNIDKELTQDFEESLLEVKSSKKRSRSLKGRSENTQNVSLSEDKVVSDFLDIDSFTERNSSHLAKPLGIKRPRGRPKKENVVDETKPSIDSLDNKLDLVVRPRGRPRKSKEFDETVMSSNGSSTKEISVETCDNITETDLLIRPRGRPKKNKEFDDTSLESSGSSLSDSFGSSDKKMEPALVRPRGRPRKLKEFEDTSLSSLSKETSMDNADKGNLLPRPRGRPRKTKECDETSLESGISSLSESFEKKTEDNPIESSKTDAVTTESDSLLTDSFVSDSDVLENCAEKTSFELGFAEPDVAVTTKLKKNAKKPISVLIAPSHFHPNLNTNGDSAENSTKELENLLATNDHEDLNSSNIALTGADLSENLLDSDMQNLLLVMPDQEGAKAKKTTKKSKVNRPSVQHLLDGDQNIAATEAIGENPTVKIKKTTSKPHKSKLAIYKNNVIVEGGLQTTDSEVGESAKNIIGIIEKTISDIGADIGADITNISKKVDALIEESILDTVAKRGRKGKPKNKFAHDSLSKMEDTLENINVLTEASTVNDNRLDNTASKASLIERNDSNFDNIIKPNLKQRSAKNGRKTKSKAKKIILSQNNKDQIELDNALIENKNLNSIVADPILVLDENLPKDKDQANSDTNAIIDQEPPIKIIINKQKTRRKSKSFKKVDLKGQNDLFQDFSLVIKKSKRIAPIITYTPADTFSHDIYPGFIEKPPTPEPVTQAEPVSEAMSSETDQVEEDLDASVEEMDMELDEIPITTSIIERDTLTFTNILHVPVAVAKPDVHETTTNNKTEEVPVEELFQPPEKDLPLATEEEVFLYETGKRSSRNKSNADILSSVQEVEISNRKSRVKSKNKVSLDDSYEISEDISNFGLITKQMNTQAYQNGVEDGFGDKKPDKTVGAMSNIFDLISTIGKEEIETGSFNEMSASTKKCKKSKLANHLDEAADFDLFSSANKEVTSNKKSKKCKINMKTFEEPTIFSLKGEERCLIMSAKGKCNKSLEETHTFNSNIGDNEEKEASTLVIASSSSGMQAGTNFDVISTANKEEEKEMSVSNKKLKKSKINKKNLEEPTLFSLTSAVSNWDEKKTDIVYKKTHAQEIYTFGSNIGETEEKDASTLVPTSSSSEMQDGKNFDSISNANKEEEKETSVTNKKPKKSKINKKNLEEPTLFSLTSAITNWEEKETDSLLDKKSKKAKCDANLEETHSDLNIVEIEERETNTLVQTTISNLEMQEANVFDLLASDNKEEEKDLSISNKKLKKPKINNKNLEEPLFNLTSIKKPKKSKIINKNLEEPTFLNLTSIGKGEETERDILVDKKSKEAKCDKKLEETNALDFSIAETEVEETNTFETASNRKKSKSHNKKLEQAHFDSISETAQDILPEIASPINESKIKRGRKKKTKPNIPDIELAEESIEKNVLPLVENKIMPSKEKDIDSIYAFTESEDLEIEKPVEKPKRTSRKQTMSFSEDIDALPPDVCDVEPKADAVIDDVSTAVTKKRSRSGRDLASSNVEEKDAGPGEIKENDVGIDGRRKSVRSAKVKALEHIHDDALAELTDSERNRDLDKGSVVVAEDSEELTKKRASKRQNKAQKASNLVENSELPEEKSELPTDLINDLEELNKELVDNDKCEENLDGSMKKKANKNTNKPPKIPKLLDSLDVSKDSLEKALEELNNIDGLEELENSIEKELNAMDDKKKTRQPKSKLLKELEVSKEMLNEPNLEDIQLNLADERNQELRRSRRGSRKVASYNENDLIDPLLDEIDGKRKNRKKDKTEAVTEKKLNSDELFDLLKASSNEQVSVPKPQSFLNTLEESSLKEFNDDNFDNVFEDILEKSTFLIQSNLKEKDIDKIYEFTESPEAIEPILPLESSKRVNKKLPKRNLSPSKPPVEETSESMSIAPDSSFSVPTTPDISELSRDSKTKSTKSDKTTPSDKPNYCEICNKSFIRLENLIKHKRTLTHIQKLSEIEAKEAAEKSKSEQTDSKTSDSIIEISPDSTKIADLSKNDINISDILQESNKPTGQHSSMMHSSFPSNHSLKLADIINDVLNKPVLEGDNEKRNSFSDIIMHKPDAQPEYRRYKSLGERKSFDSEPIEPQPIPLEEPYISKTTILEKQISLLENIIENQAGVNYIDDISMSSNNSLENNVLENNLGRCSPSELSLKQDDSSNVTYGRNNSLKPNTQDDSFLKPSQYEEISEDSVNLRNYEDQKLRKTLNRDEELFLECCSLLKSGSEVSSYSNKKSHNKVLGTMGLKQCDEPEWLERKSLVQKPLYDTRNDYSDDNSRIPTPLGDSYDDDASNSNTITSNWNINKVPVFEDVTPEKRDPGNNSFSFEEVLDEYDEKQKKGKLKGGISKFGGILTKTIGNQVKTLPKIINRKDFGDVINEEEASEKKAEELSDGSTSDSKKMITKGARKVFEGLKVSIPTEELNLEEVLNCSPKSKKMDIQNTADSAKPTQEVPSMAKPARTARKSKPVKNKSQFGSNLLFKMNKKKVLSPTTDKKKDDDVKTHDIYDFEETQDNTDVFTKPDFRTFRSMKCNEPLPEPESDTESRDCVDSFIEAKSRTSSISSSSLKKPKTQENITKKKCMIMGRIFKNAAKSKIEDIDEEIRDIPELDNSELVENYVAECTKVIKNVEVAKPKLSEKEINQLFDQLLENKLENHEASADPKPAVKKPEAKKPDIKKKTKPKNRKRVRTNSDSTDDEFNLNKTIKKRAYRKNGKAEDNCINLEQELKECIGVASRKSQRKCTSGKQNVLVEYWSSDDSQFEALLETQRIEVKQVNEPIKETKNVTESEIIPRIPENLPKEVEPVVEEPKSEPSEKQHKPKNPQQKRKPLSEKKPKSASNGKTTDAVTSNRRKRAAANPLYHWSSSSEDESQDLIEVKPIRDEVEDDEDRPVQHGWIVGDSPKKLVTMLAQAKGKKTDIDCVKEQGKKRTNAVS